MPAPKVIVSACLIGKKCRFDGCSCADSNLINDLEKIEIIPVCPEEIGGLETPRPRARIVGKNGLADGSDVLSGEARVLTYEGKDVTKEYLRGGEKSLAIAQSTGVNLAILKSNSPSCGCGNIFTEDFKQLKEGNGTTTAIFKKAGINVVNENNYHKALDNQKNL